MGQRVAQQPIGMHSNPYDTIKVGLGPNARTNASMTLALMTSASTMRMWNGLGALHEESTGAPSVDSKRIDHEQIVKPGLVSTFPNAMDSYNTPT